MADNKNIFSIDGTLYAKDSRTVAGVKDPTQSYTFNSITLELTSGKDVQNKDGGSRHINYTEFPVFECSQGVNLDEFAIGDYISVRFALSGKEFKNKQGNKQIITKLRALYIKFADLGTERPSSNGKINASVSDTRELERKEEVFKQPDPMGDDSDYDQLPF